MEHSTTVTESGTLKSIRRCLSRLAPGGIPPYTSMRAKGFIAFAALAIYALAVGLFTNFERSKLLDMVDEMEQVHRVEEQLVQINMSMARTLLSVNVAFSNADPITSAPGTLIELDATRSLLGAFEADHPRVLMLAHKLEALINDLTRTPTRGLLAVTRDNLHELILELDGITEATRARKAMLLDDYQRTYDRTTLQGMIFAVLGLVAIGTVSMIFFGRITADICMLRTRAREIVDGYRGAPLAVTRTDEVGNLMEAVNHMQRDLRERERHIERVRQEQFHREKMAAVGSLAAQLAHEINNPIAAISGVVGSIIQMRESHNCPHHGEACRPDLILEQTRRISLITRQIADFSRPRSTTPQLVDLNHLIRSTCAFIGYDRRFRGLTVETDLDPELPAVRTLGDQVTQVLMNILINAADALEGCPPESGRIIVRSRTEHESVSIEIVDNGRGMDRDTLSHVFEEYFTTKPEGKGSGLGLALSRELINDMAGVLVLDSTPGKGTIARIELPVRTPEQSAAQTRRHA